MDDIRESLIMSLHSLSISPTVQISTVLLRTSFEFLEQQHKTPVHIIASSWTKQGKEEREISVLSVFDRLPAPRREMTSNSQQLPPTSQPLSRVGGH